MGSFLRYPRSDVEVEMEMQGFTGGAASVASSCRLEPTWARNFR